MFEKHSQKIKNIVTEFRKNICSPSKYYKAGTPNSYGGYSGVTDSKTWCFQPFNSSRQ